LRGCTSKRETSVARLFKHFILSAAVLLASCATFNVSKDYSLADKTGSGLVVLSLTHTLGGVTVEYRPVGGQKMGAFMTGNMQDPLDWDKPRGRLVVMELPAGTYELYQWRSGRGAYVTYTSKTFYIPFTVVQGKATYIGSFFIDADEATQKYRMELTDRSDRDIPLLLEKYKNIKESDVNKKISKII
jgi:hypothetical protein